MKLRTFFLDLIRRSRLVHFILNLKEKKSIAPNKMLYPKAGITKSAYSSIKHQDFKNSKKYTASPWLDTNEGKEKLQKALDEQSFPEEVKEQIKTWPEQGYMILKGFFNEETIDNINRDVEQIHNQKQLPTHLFHEYKIMNCFKRSAAVKNCIQDPSLLEILCFLLGKKVKPFQSINFIKGSKSSTHSDSIHMTTEPLGYLLAIWVALEDVHPDAGPLHYFPGTHTLPYIMNEDYETGNGKFFISSGAYDRYLEKIREVVRNNNLHKTDFLAKKGDLLIWHANLLHGGSPVRNSELTRKSLVGHYFAEDVICYHELTERPAIKEDV